MSLAEKADAEIESYVLDEIWSSRVHPIRLYCGRDHTGICFICAPDMGAAGLEWCRYPGEPESGFTRRAANDIRIARNMPPVSEPTAEDAEALAAVKPRRGVGSYGPRHNAPRVRA
jgi:hypothetical protein